MDESNALKAWEFDNSISLVDPHLDALYDYSATSQAAINSLHPWRENPHHFTRVRISAVALLKMVMHARSGGSLEVMGLMQGHIANDTFVVTDAFRLPVDGTETRVNAHEEANEYMVSYLSASRDAGQPENAVGWYHSHPGYGCWLSGIDVSTQLVHQKFEDPFLAVVIDPDRTVSAGKVDIGAFRTLPEDYKARDTEKHDEGRAGQVIDEDEDEYQTIPLSKIEDFGAHSNKYYPLEVSHFKSSLDSKILAQLWNKYWVATLSSNSLLSNRDYMSKTMNDLAAKVRRAGTDVGAKSLMGKGVGRGGGSGKARGKEDQALEGLLRDSNKITGEETAGLIGQRIKAKLFNDVAQVAAE